MTYLVMVDGKRHDAETLRAAVELAAGAVGRGADRVSMFESIDWVVLLSPAEREAVMAARRAVA